MFTFSKKIIDTLISGGVGVIPTDTIYGIVGRAELPKTVKRIYKIRKRDKNKPCIILISSIDDLKKFDIKISKNINSFLRKKKIWPGMVSIVFPSKNSDFDYISRGSKSISFRIPDSKKLLALLKKTGPLIAPSANTQGDPPAINIKLAKKYFTDLIDFYVDGGEINNLPSTLIEFKNEKPVVLREGAVKI